MQPGPSALELLHKSLAIYLVRALQEEWTNSLTFMHTGPDNSGSHCIYCPQCHLSIQLYETGIGSTIEIKAKELIKKDPVTGVITLHISYDEVLYNVTQVVEKIKWFINILKLDS